MTVFHENFRLSQRRLARARFLGRILRLFSFGIISLRKKVKVLEREAYLRHKDLEEYLLASKEYEDMKRYLAFCEIHGTGVTNVGPRTPLTVRGCDYGPDWIDTSQKIKRKDGFVCQEADGRCRGPLQAHHIVSLSHGGTNAEDNLITLCEYHHSLKHSHMKRRM
jgi:hypothetical protein